MTTQGNLFILSAPSGAGKSSLISALLKKETGRQLEVSVSHTTRQPRPGEINGVHYHFVDVEQFKALINEGAFFEWAEVFGNFYGTSKLAIDDQLNQGIDVFLDIDWQGAQQVRQLHPDVVTIFISPPSLSELEKRLRGRGQDSDETIAGRMAAAKSECSHYHEFDYIIVNDDFEQALNELTTIVVSKRLTGKQQQQKHRDLFNDLLAND